MSSSPTSETTAAAGWMPEATAHHEKLAALAGTWRGEETLFPSPWLPEGGTAVARVESRMDLDGFFLVTDYEERRDERVTYRGHGVFGYDTKAQRYTMYWFDSLGGDMPHGPALGAWEGDTLRFESAHEAMKSTFTYVLAGPDRYTFRIEQSRDGGATWVPFVEGRYTRRG